MSPEITVSKKFRILVDAKNRIYHLISFWTKAVDVFFNSGKNAQDTLGNIYGISDSLTSTSSNIAASTAAIKVINDKITGINLGDATQADVLTGKKFSSQAGLNKIGTMANLNGAVGYGTIQDGTTFARIFLNNTGKITQGSSYVDVSCDDLKDNVNDLNSGNLTPLKYIGGNGDAGKILNITQTITPTKTGKILLTVTIGSINENFRFSYNNCSVSVNNSSCFYSPYIEPLIDPSGADNYNWAEKSFYYIVDGKQNVDITVNIYASTPHAGHVWMLKAFYFS